MDIQMHNKLSDLLTVAVSALASVVHPPQVITEIILRRGCSSLGHLKKSRISRWPNKILNTWYL